MSTQQRIGALDLGTTGVRFVIFNAEGVELASAYREIPLVYPQPGWVEQDPEEMIQASLAVIHQALQRAGLQAKDLAGFGVTNQRETVIAWERATGWPLAPAIVWQDRRTADRCETLRHSAWADRIGELTGLVLDPYFSATKIEWMIQHVPGLREKLQQGEVLFGTVDSWILFRLTGLGATDPTNASRTMLFDLHQRRWRPELCELFGTPMEALPEVRSSLSIFATTRKDLFGAEVPVAGVLGDQQAALFGQTGFEAGQVKVTWGTGAFLLLNTGQHPAPPPQGVLSTLAYTDSEEAYYALEGSVFVAGAAVQWLRDSLGIIRSAQETESLAQSLPNNEGVYFVPALVGLGAPHWDPYARGLLIGLTRGTGPAHLARAALEAIAYQTHDLLRIMEERIGSKIQELRVDGGAAKNDFLCQFQADILGIPVIRPKILETTALGAAFAAGLALGFWPDRQTLRAIWAEDRRFLPRMTPTERENLLAGWQQALQRARHWAK
ncbi:MAG TPA: glycerol kinase GlpK [Thermoguttaceae bacterium]|nr:glycerol kinase GlpK [Thermoguttaceae bacterium]